MDIDWSKAPEGATHFSEGDPRNGKYPAWWRPISKRDDLFECWAIGTSFGCEIWQSGPFHLPEKAVKREWIGEGWPPVGTVCEWKAPASNAWIKTEIVFQSNWAIVLRDTSKTPHPDGPVDIPIDLTKTQDPEFRQIRTPEQIATEKRAAEIEEMRNIYAGSSETTIASGMSALYDAGYRKQVQP